jgi:hypothetical protein
MAMPCLSIPFSKYGLFNLKVLSVWAREPWGRFFLEPALQPTRKTIAHSNATLIFWGDGGSIFQLVLEEQGYCLFMNMQVLAS